MCDTKCIHTKTTKSLFRPVREKVECLAVGAWRNGGVQHKGSLGMGRKNKGSSGKKNPSVGQNIPQIPAGWLKCRITALPSTMLCRGELEMGSGNKQNP